MIFDILPPEINSIIFDLLDEISLIVLDSVSQNDPMKFVKSKIHKSSALITKEYHCQIAKYSIEYINFFVNNNIVDKYDMYFASARVGGTKYLKYEFPDMIIEPFQLLSKSIRLIPRLYYEAAIGDSVEVLRWLDSTVPRRDNKKIIEEAAGAGSLNAFQELYDLGYEWDRSAIIAASKYNHANILRKLIIIHEPLLYGWETIEESSLLCLARDGSKESLNVLEQLHNEDHEIYYGTRALAFSGNIEPLEWSTNVCYLDIMIYEDAIKYDYDHIIEWLYAHQDRITTNDEFKHTACSIAISVGKYKKIPYLLNLGYTLTPECMIVAIENNDEIKFLFEYQCPINTDCYYIAACVGNIKILDMLYGANSHIDRSMVQDFYFLILGTYILHHNDDPSGGIITLPDLLCNKNVTIGSIDNLVEILDWAVQHGIEFTVSDRNDTIDALNNVYDKIKFVPIYHWIENNS